MQFNTERRTAALGSAPRWKRNAVTKHKIQPQTNYRKMVTGSYNMANEACFTYTLATIYGAVSHLN
jgi:hypothetical protein